MPLPTWTNPCIDNGYTGFDISYTLVITIPGFRLQRRDHAGEPPKARPQADDEADPPTNHTPTMRPGSSCTLGQTRRTWKLQLRTSIVECRVSNSRATGSCTIYSPGCPFQKSSARGLSESLKLSRVVCCHDQAQKMRRSSRPQKCCCISMPKI